MTSDHRVAGSSPAGCKELKVSNLQQNKSNEKRVKRPITCQSFATFEANPPWFTYPARRAKTLEPPTPDCQRSMPAGNPEPEPIASPPAHESRTCRENSDIPPVVMLVITMAYL
jgi:hypothetical protein